MNKKEVVAIGVRFFAIYIAVYILSEFIRGAHLYFIGMPFAFDNDFILGAVITLSLIMVIVLLWRFALNIAGFIIPFPASADEPSGISSDWVEPVAFTVLGLLVLSSAIPSIFHWVFRYHLFENMRIEAYGQTPQRIASMLSTIVKLMIGLWLIFGAKGLKGLLTLFRTSGQQRKIS